MTITASHFVCSDVYVKFKILQRFKPVPLDIMYTGKYLPLSCLFSAVRTGQILKLLPYVYTCKKKYRSLNCQGKFKMWQNCLQVQKGGGKKPRQKIYSRIYCRIIIVRGDQFFVAFMGNLCPRIYNHFFLMLIQIILIILSK